MLCTAESQSLIVFLSSVAAFFASLYALLNTSTPAAASLAASASAL
jgi:hypothetical protein